MHVRDALAEAGYTERIAFVVELAQHLHAYGTTAQRLEGAIESVTRRLSLACEPWANPTGMILAFSDPARPAGESDTTRVIRLGLGDTDLYKLCEADRIAEDVMAGRLDIPAGRAALRALDRPASKRGKAMQVLGFALASAAVAGLLRLPWLDIGTAGAIGLLIGADNACGFGSQALACWQRLLGFVIVCAECCRCFRRPVFCTKAV